MAACRVDSDGWADAPGCCAVPSLTPPITTIPLLHPSNTGRQATLPSDRQQFIEVLVLIFVLCGQTKSGDTINPSNVDIWLLPFSGSPYVSYFNNVQFGQTVFYGLGLYSVL